MSYLPDLTKTEAAEVLANKVAEINTLISECEALADAHDLSFSLDPAYGMGGTYRDGEWNASSQSC